MKVTIEIQLTGAFIELLDTVKNCKARGDNFWLYNNETLAWVSGNIIRAETTAGNRVMVSPSWDTTLVEITIDSRRHAIRNSGNVVGMALTILGLFDYSGSPTPLAKEAKVINFVSARKDIPWWEVNREHYRTVKCAEEIAREYNPDYGHILAESPGISPFVSEKENIWHWAKVEGFDTWVAPNGAMLYWSKSQNSYIVVGGQ